MSTFTPLSYWFVDAKQRELDETTARYHAVVLAQAAFTETPITIGRRIYELFDHLPDAIADPCLHALHDLVVAEPFWNVTGPSFERMSLQEFVEYRNLLHRQEYFFANQAGVLGLFHEGLTRLIVGVVRELPDSETPSPFTIPLIYALPDPRGMVEKTLGTVFSGDYADAGLFKKLGATLEANLMRVSGITDPASAKPAKLPSQSTMPFDEMVRAYLGGTPFEALFLTPVPLRLTQEERFSHMHIVGGTRTPHCPRPPISRSAEFGYCGPARRLGATARARRSGDRGSAHHH
ncbi:hypothetical protein [Brevundimonas sp.]|uniref:hypothetical protein n=1 Tax=Brevundimonas sp. TaxID=1871086 RepID=UPI003D0DE9F8